MATRKRNEYLDIDLSDEEGSDRGYDSEAAEESKGRAAKRRKVLTVDNDDDEVDVSDSENEGDRNAEKGQSQPEDGGHDEDVTRREDEEKIDDASSPSRSKSTPTTTTTTKKKQTPLDKRPPKKDKTGVIYLSSLPPYLKPAALKTLLLQRGFGPITRVFLTPAVAPNSGGKQQRSNRRKTYTDGWVEFASKKTAKVCAETLNASIVGGKKNGERALHVEAKKRYKGANL
jgi:ESF2/ABP1 family protein